MTTTTMDTRIKLLAARVAKEFKTVKSTHATDKASLNSSISTLTTNLNNQISKEANDISSVNTKITNLTTTVTNNNTSATTALADIYSGTVSDYVSEFETELNKEENS